jgi:hypothetical protein
MTRKLKMLGMAFVAVLALSAVSATAASAQKSYTCSAYPCTATGESAIGNDVFQTEGGKVECTSVYHVDAINAPTNDLTVTPTYTGCKAFGFVEAKVEMGSCHYTFTTPTETTGPDDLHAPVDVVCSEAAKPITVTAGTCKITIGAQTTGGVVNITNDTAAGDVTVKAAVTGIAYTVVTDGFGCPFAGTGAKAGGTYTQANPVTIDSPVSTTKIDIG